MEFYQAVSRRRSIFKFTDKQVVVEDLLPLLALSIMAPNHHLTQPWQFLWIGKKHKLVLSEVYALARAKKKVGENSALFLQEVDRAKEKFLATPAILMVACRVDKDPVVAEEDYAATCCAIQNLLLAMTDVGLGAQWSTHPMIKDKTVLKLLGLAEDQRLVAMLYIGYPAVIPPVPPKKAVEEVLKVLP